MLLGSKSQDPHSQGYMEYVNGDVRDNPDDRMGESKAPIAGMAVKL